MPHNVSWYLADEKCKKKIIFTYIKWSNLGQRNGLGTNYWKIERNNEEQFSLSSKILTNSYIILNNFENVISSNMLIIANI